MKLSWVMSSGTRCSFCKS